MWQEKEEFRANVAAKSWVAWDLRAATDGAVLAHRARGRVVGGIECLLEAGSDTRPTHADP